MAALIGLDWGTSSLRAALIAADGTILDRRHSPHGITRLPEGGFEAAFVQAIGPWHRTQPDLPVVASGMVGARTGWAEAPYVACPGDAAKIAANILHLRTGDGMTLHILPGMSTRNALAPDVMRGEETQILGCLAAGTSGGLFVLPGTHSKWVSAASGSITGFASYLTGELFAALRSQTILRHTMPSQDEPDPVDRGAFARGVERAGDKSGGGILRRLFGTRALALFGELDRKAGPSYLSGLLIGAELAEAIDEFGKPDRALVLVGGADLAERYAEAAAIFGIETLTAEPDAAFTGQLLVARLAGLVTETR